MKLEELIPISKEAHDRMIEEDKKKALQDIDLAYRERELSDSYFGHGGFKETDCVVDFENEDVVFFLRYKTSDYKEGYGYGLIDYDFYIVKREGKYFIKYVDKMGLCDVAGNVTKSKMGVISWDMRFNIGFMMSEYKRCVRNELMKETPPISEDEMIGKLKMITKEDFPNHTLEYLTYKGARTKVQVIDLYNGVHFITHDYILSKYSMIVDIINFIFEKCDIPYLKKCNLKFIDSIMEAKKLILFEEIEEEYWEL